MIILLSPAKTLDLSEVHYEEATLPRLLKESESLVKELRKKSARSLKKLMKVSDAIATLNVERYQQFSLPFTEENSKPASLTFKGDVYLGLQMEELDLLEREFAQKHLRILSGLYGLLKPMDLIQPYRLEMGTPLKKGKKKNLYEFWDKKITQLINEDLEAIEGKYIVNLASKEYFKSVKLPLLRGKLINVDFKEERNGTLKVISFNAKKARGGMAKQILQERITDPALIKELEVDGYQFNATLSTEEQLTFVK